MKKSSILACLVLISFVASAASGDVSPFEIQTAPTPPSKIDELVGSRLNELGLEPARLCSDAVFVRRVYLDVIGTLPTIKEAGDFLASRDPNKRSTLIDGLLEREEFADYWAMKWCDLEATRRSSSPCIRSTW